MIPRRTVVVWAALIGSMTVSAGLLFWLEPGPIAPANTSLSLSVVARGDSARPVLFQTAQPLRSELWDRIVIHHSGTASGNAATIGQTHSALGYGSLGYHFVIGNGHGANDGLVQIGPRWQQQAEGAYEPRTVSICLVGNGDQAPPTRAQFNQLVALIRALQQRLDIGVDNVVPHSQLAPTTSPGEHFPMNAVRVQLAGLAAH